MMSLYGDKTVPPKDTGEGSRLLRDDAVICACDVLLPYRRKHVHRAASRFQFFLTLPSSSLSLLLPLSLALSHSLSVASLPDNSGDGGARSIECGGHHRRSSSGGCCSSSIFQPGPFTGSESGLGASILGSVSDHGRLPAAALLPRPGVRAVPWLSAVWPRTDDPRRGGV